ncbi:unnamed protein product [Phytomonas sp. Hart1]|nr:unnamed protein product [Phytomonas sp. Hart1]|eukprot:CCW66343.1 unnamed protein product [Phytomonas sp. isolate Hart1]
MAGEPNGLHRVYLNKNILECDKPIIGTVNPVIQEECVAPSVTYSCPINCGTYKTSETQPSKILPTARSYYNHSTKCNTLGCSTPCTCLPHCSRLESCFGTPPQTLHTLRRDDVKKDGITPSRPLRLDESVECSFTTETQRNTRKAFERISFAIQENRTTPNRLLGSLDKVTFSKPSAGRDPICQLPYYLNILPHPHEFMTNTNIGCIAESNTQPRILSQSTTTLQKSRGLSPIFDIHTEEDVLEFFDLTRSDTANALMTPNDNSLSALESTTSGKLFGKNTLSVINTALDVSFRRDGAKRRLTNSLVAVLPAQKKKHHMDMINTSNVGRIDREK